MGGGERVLYSVYSGFLPTLKFCVYLRLWNAVNSISTTWNGDPKEVLRGSFFLEGPFRVWSSRGVAVGMEGCVLFENIAAITPVGKMFDVVLISNSIKRMWHFHLSNGGTGWGDGKRGCNALTWTMTYG